VKTNNRISGRSSQALLPTKKLHSAAKMQKKPSQNKSKNGCGFTFLETALGQ